MISEPIFRKVLSETAEKERKGSATKISVSQLGERYLEQV